MDGDGEPYRQKQNRSTQNETGSEKTRETGGEMAAETQPFKAAYPAAQCLRWTHK